MISPDVLHIDWIKEVSAKNNKADKILVEKVIRALLLLEGLSESRTDFVFKGGTALMLLQGSTKRLSIDIDIIMPRHIPLDAVFDKIVQDRGFTRFELQERNTTSNIHKEHYKFHYQPAYKKDESEEYVLLDILYEEPQYQQTILQQVDSPFVLQIGPPITVRVPCFDDILGDKLTAFAPNTTGIPYEKNGFSRAMEIIKQLYDIGNIFEHAKDPLVFSKTFSLFAKTEMAYRSLAGVEDQVLDDIIDTALTITSRGQLGNGKIKDLMRGIAQLKNYIFSESYHIEKAITHASRAAYTAAIIKAKENNILRFTNPGEVKDWNIQNQAFNKLNKLKKSNPEAFFYWFNALTLLNLTDDPK
jgi:hypothetical protein